MRHTKHQAGHKNSRSFPISQKTVHKQFPEKQLLHHRGHEHGKQHRHPQSGIHQKFVQLAVVHAGRLKPFHKLSQQVPCQPDSHRNHKAGRKLTDSPGLPLCMSASGYQLDQGHGNGKCHKIHGNGGQKKDSRPAE